MVSSRMLKGMTSTPEAQTSRARRGADVRVGEGRAAHDHELALGREQHHRVDAGLVLVAARVNADLDDEALARELERLRGHANPATGLAALAAVELGQAVAWVGDVEDRLGDAGRLAVVARGVDPQRARARQRGEAQRAHELAGVVEAIVGILDVGERRSFAVLVDVDEVSLAGWVGRVWQRGAAEAGDAAERGRPGDRDRRKGLRLGGAPPPE